MDEAGARTVTTTIAAMYHSVHEQMREHIRGLDRGTPRGRLHREPLPQANSIAVLVVHTLGSEREVIHAVRSQTTERDRPGEFRAEGEADELLALLAQAAREVERS